MAVEELRVGSERGGYWKSSIGISVLAVVLKIVIVILIVILIERQERTTKDAGRSTWLLIKD